MSREFHLPFARRGIFRTTLVGVIAMLAAGAAQAQTITVNDTSDPGTGSTCTLRDAINLAQGASPTGTCTKNGSGPLTIIFSVTGTITLSSTAGPLPALSSPTNLTISRPKPASSSAITISGDETVAIISIDGAVVNLNYLTLSGGASTEGGANL
jgi:CSLREA domain-containing protein